jgi:hypothetical protein
MKSCCILALSLAGILMIEIGAHAAIVYNNTSTQLNLVNALLPAGAADSIEHGNQITLGSGERIVTSITVRLRIQGAGVATFNRRLRIYANDGPKGEPGTQLWDSGSLFGVIDSGADISYSFAVPNVRVPESFTYTVQATNRQTNMALMGPSEYNPPTVGSTIFGYWRNLNGEWEFINPDEPPFGTRVEANPIPGDVNIDGSVDVDDLLAVINAWGACPTPPVTCPADVAPPGGDDQVNVDDLLAVINNWG